MPLIIGVDLPLSFAAANDTSEPTPTDFSVWSMSTSSLPQKWVDLRKD